jgi:hypothetical protein
VELRVHHDRLLLVLAGGRREKHTQRDVRHAHLQLGVKAAAKERVKLARFLHGKGKGRKKRLLSSCTRDGRRAAAHTPARVGESVGESGREWERKR